MKRLGITIVLAAILSIGNLAARTFVFDPDLKIGFDAGTTGIGFTVESRINDMLGVRTGFDWMPHFEMPLYFHMEVGDGKNPVYEDGRSRFDRMAEKLEEITGFKIDQKVKMLGEPNMYNFKLLIDIYPLQDKRWHFTTGFYSGPSVIARARNSTEDMTKLIIAAFYNNIYENLYDLEYNNDGEAHGVIMGLELTKELTDKILSYGRIGMHVGDYKNQTSQDGKPLRYTLGPDTDNMVKAEMRVNSFKPYLGVGFNGPLDKNNDRFNIIMECGIMFWGGHPKVYTHDGTEIVDDLTNLNKQIAHYVDYVRPFEVFPVLNLSLNYRLFK